MYARNTSQQMYAQQASETLGSTHANHQATLHVLLAQEVYSKRQEEPEQKAERKFKIKPTAEKTHAPAVLDERRKQGGKVLHPQFA